MNISTKKNLYPQIDFFLCVFCEKMWGDLEQKAVDAQKDLLGFSSQ